MVTSLVGFMYSLAFQALRTLHSPLLALETFGRKHYVQRLDIYLFIMCDSAIFENSNFSSEKTFLIFLTERLLLNAMYLMGV